MTKAEKLRLKALAEFWVLMSDWFTWWDDSRGPVGGETFKSWARGLPFTPEQIRAATETIAKSGAARAPEFPQFRMLCESNGVDLDTIEAELTAWARTGGGYFQSDLAFNVALILSQDFLRRSTRDQIRRALPAALREARSLDRPAPRPRKPIEPDRQIEPEAGPKQTEQGRRTLEEIRKTIYGKAERTEDDKET